MNKKTTQKRLNKSARNEVIERERNYILGIGKSVLKIASKSIDFVHESLDDSFVEAVKLLYNTKGNIVLSGIGKSGIIGKKIVATLQSTGIPSSFVHPVDALHGDLGMIKPEDTVIVISNSGETEELVTFVKIIKSANFGNRIITISSNNNSSIAKCSDIVLQTHVKTENEEENFRLIPTTSTTVTLSLSDALVIALLKKKNFQIKNFYRNHPGGKIEQELKTIK